MKSETETRLSAKRWLGHVVTFLGIVSVGSCGGSCASSVVIAVCRGRDFWHTAWDVGIFLFFTAGWAGLAAGVLGLFRRLFLREPIKDTALADAMMVLAPLIALCVLVLWLLVEDMNIMALG